jgi:Ice-binding-like
MHVAQTFRSLSNTRGHTRFASVSRIVSVMMLAACAADAPSGLHAPAVTLASESPLGRGPAPVRLGTSGTFAILSKTGITDVYASAVAGDVGTSPITGAALLLSCGEVTGRIFVVDAAGPPCAVNDATTLTTAVRDMETAYLDAEGRVSPDFTELGAGEIGGLTLRPGLYKWGTSVLITNDVTLSGGPNDVWIFQVAGSLDEASAARITLTGGARPGNVFWQVAGGVSIGTTAHFEGVVLTKTLVAAKTGATVTGRLLAQTAVTLQMNSIAQPAP